MKRHKSISPMLRNRDLSFWTPVNFEVENFLNGETEGVLTDIVIYFYDQHLTWLSQLKPTMDFRPREALFFGDNFFKLVTIGFNFSQPSISAQAPISINMVS